MNGKAARARGAGSRASLAWKFHTPWLQNVLPALAMARCAVTAPGRRETMYAQWLAMWLLLLTFGVSIAFDCANAANVDGASSVTNTLPTPAVGTDLLQFLDGSSLHGKLRSVD